MRPPVTEHVPLHSNHYVKIWHESLGCANNIRPLSWRGAQTEKIHKLKYKLPAFCQNVWPKIGNLWQDLVALDLMVSCYVLLRSLSFQVVDILGVRTIYPLHFTQRYYTQPAIFRTTIQPTNNKMARWT